MTGEHAVGRVIARPFSGRRGRVRSAPKGGATSRSRRPARSYLQELTRRRRAGARRRQDLGPVRGRRGRRTRIPARPTRGARDSVASCSRSSTRGLVFVEPDRDRPGVRAPQGRARLRTRRCAQIDAERRRRMLARLREDDLLIVTADHGVDPAHPGTDHTREYAPLLARRRGRCSRADRAARAVTGGSRHDGPLADVGATRAALADGARRAEQARARGLPGDAFVS